MTWLRRMRGSIVASPSGDFIDLASRRVLGSPPGRLARRRYAAILRGGDRLGLLTAMLQHPGHADRVVAALESPTTRAEPDAEQADEAFVRRAFREILDRAADDEGLRHYTARLASGSSQEDVVRALVASEEYLQSALRRYFPLEDLRQLRPERYSEVRKVGGEGALAFRAEEAADFDWLESAIIEGGYYDKPGVWSLSVDTDKRLMAEIVCALEPTKVLELGCASGSVLKCLSDNGIDAEGVEISSAAIGSAVPEVRPRIHQANATSFDLGSDYDVIFGLDVFEHLNPNHLGECLRRIETHLRPGGFVYCNIPAFGPDRVFGEVFPVYLLDWVPDLERGTYFRTLHVDELGYPLNGHLIWAHTDWWVQRFEDFGFRRESDIEAALRDRYETYFRRVTPARRSMYVFSKDACPRDVGHIEMTIRTSTSAVLAALPRES